MNGIWKKLLSLFLALTLALQLLPVQAMAAELQESESLTVEDQETTVTEDATIVAEVPSGRDEFQKEFILSNGLRMISISGAAIHYQEDGEWKEIDNTLQPISSTGAVLSGKTALTAAVAYKNTAGIWDVKLPASLNANNAVEVSRDGYTLSFQFAGEIHNNHVVMSVGDETELSSVEVSVVESAQEEELMEATASAELSELSETAEQETDISSVEGSEALNEASETVVADQAVAAITTQVNTVSAAVLDLSSTTSAAPQQEYMDKLYSAVTYSDIYSNTDLRYDLQSNQLKESVIIKQAKDTLAGYKYTLSAPGMTLELQQDNSILAYAADAEEGDEPIFYMPAPFLVDDNLSYNDNITVSLQQSGDTYTLTYSLPRAWLLEEERAYPVVLDPIITPDRGRFDIEDQTVFSAGSMSYTWGCVATGYSKNLGKARTLIRFTEIPKLTSADVIVSADISFYLLETNATTLAMEAHKVLNGGWRSSSVTWSDMNDAGVDYNPTIEDYALVKSADWYEWDITDVARGWYETGVNSGVMFKVTDTVENAGVHDTLEFCSSDWGGSKNPYLNITYINNCGLEDYWDYTSQSVGRAGTGYVNNFTGNLVWIHNGLSFAGNRMPVSISHVYNANDKSNNNYGLSYGWRTNYNQRVYQWTEDSTYYVWEDQDGTRRYFKYSSSGTYKNEIDNTLVLTTTGSGDEKYRITDKNGNKSYFDADGRLKKICNNQQTVSSITISYISSTSKLIDFITDGADRVYKFNYNLEDLLSSIEFMGTESDPISTLTYTYDSNSNLIGITYPDNQSVAYGYTTNHLLTSAEDIGGYKVTYDYNVTSTTEPNRVIHIAEFDGSTAGGSLDIEYAHNQTTFVDHNGNKEIVQFNKYGSTVSIQDGLGRAQFAQYGVKDNAQSASQLSLSSKLQNTVVNLAPNGSFETTDSWAAASGNASDGSWAYDSTTNYLGAKSLKITRTTDDTVYSVYSSSSCPVEPGKSYTLSAYVKTEDMDASGGGAKIALKLSGGSEEVATSKAVKVTSDWTRLEATYLHPEDASAGNLVVHLVNLSSGSAYFDCVQLEQSASASRYNLVENGDFRNGTTSWTKNSSCTADDTSYEPDADDETTPANLFISAAPQLDTTYYRIIGSAIGSKTVSQTITLTGSEKDVFTLGGWAKGDSVPLSGDRKFGLAVTFIDSDGTAGTTQTLSFNPDSDSENNWQYAATRVIADKDYSSVRVDLLYCNNQNEAYFDGIQLFKEEFGQSYTYDDNGNVESVIDLQKQKTNYEYADNQLTGVFEYLGETKKYIAEYEYDEYNNVTKAIAEDDTVTHFAYDTYGNNTAVAVSDDPDLTFVTDEETGKPYGVNVADGKWANTSFADYTDNGDQLLSVTDSLGKTTTYNYNAQTGLLISTQAAHEEPIPAGETVPTTTYSYDSLYRTSGVTQGSSTVGYSYTNDLLSTITSASGTVYDFAYGDFDLVQSVGISMLDDSNNVIRSRTLISHEYSNDANRYLTKSTYGNGDTISYTYDDYGRTTSKTYEDSNEDATEDVVKYVYDNNGNLGLVEDSASGRTTKYLYDFQDRLSRYEESGNGYSSSVEWSYNTDNNLTSQTHVLNGTTYTTEYSYDGETKRLTGSGQGTISTEYGYDSLGRMTGITEKNSGSQVVHTTIGYTNKASTSSITSSQVASWANSVGGSYTYEYDGRGNITKIYSNGTLAAEYTYDTLDQLTVEKNHAADKRWEYTYDNGGNIKSKTTFSSVTATSGATVYYNHTDTAWKDLLTSYGDHSSTDEGNTATSYDPIGNLLSDGTWTYTWEHGRQLASMAKSGTAISYAYNADGLRTSKTVNDVTTQYYYVGDTLTGMTRGNDTLYFVYDVLDPSAVIHTNGSSSTAYYYVRNAQGDITGIVGLNDESEYEQVVAYTYDAWGNPLPITGELATTLGTLNPLRYRGYVYDQETGLYYLQSRYYNPEWGRFINADGQLNNDLLGNNQFAYCGNNPVSRADDEGSGWWYVVGVFAGAVIGAGAKIVSNISTGQKWNQGVLGAAVGGGVYSAVLMSTGSTTAAGFASSFAEAATNEILSYIPKVSSVNGTSETQVLTGENVLTSIADVMTDGITNGILLSATGKIVSSSKFLPEVPLPATDTFANAVWSEAALTSIGQTIAQGGLMVGISLGGAIGNALYGRKQDAFYVLYPE